MDKRTCAHCGKYLKPDRRAVYCGRRCVWRAWQRRTIASSLDAQSLPLATLPPDAEEILPAMGPERLQVANRLALLGRAPADARGYRVGIQFGGRQQLMRWFPPVRFRTPAMFLLEPFAAPAVPQEGTYAVIYLDGNFEPLGGPRFTIVINQVDRRLNLTDGDRTHKPRSREAQIRAGATNRNSMRAQPASGAARKLSVLWSAETGGSGWEPCYRPGYAETR